MSKPDDDIRYMVTLDGVQVRFPRPVGVDGTKWGTRIQLTDDEALLLYTQLGQYLRNQYDQQEQPRSMFRQGDAINAQELSPHHPCPTTPQETYK